MPILIPKKAIREKNTILINKKRKFNNTTSIETNIIYSFQIIKYNYKINKIISQRLRLIY